ncbi:MAG: hypothetical protein QW273_03010 [Candidatus Pacearchaeota archaeon]
MKEIYTIEGRFDNKSIEEICKELKKNFSEDFKVKYIPHSSNTYIILEKNSSESFNESKKEEIQEYLKIKFPEIIKRVYSY